VAIPPDITVTDWSGRNVLAGVREVRPRGLRIVNLADGSVRDLVDSSAEAGVPAWFADGIRIAVERRGLSPDGQTMATMPAAGPASPIGAQVTLLSLKDSTTRSIRLPFIQIAGIYWHPDGQRVFVLGREKPRGPVNVYSVPINGEAPSVIAPVGSSRQESALAVSPDGRFIAFTVAGTPSATFLRLDFSR
jgi:Tol biopolymer transport system component